MSIAHFHTEQKSENFAPELFMGKNKRCRSSTFTKALKESKKNTSCTLRAKQIEKKQDLFFLLWSGQSCTSHRFWKPLYQPRAPSRCKEVPPTVAPETMPRPLQQDVAIQSSEQSPRPCLYQQGAVHTCL